MKWMTLPRKTFISGTLHKQIYIIKIKKFENPYQLKKIATQPEHKNYLNKNMWKTDYYAILINQDLDLPLLS